MVTISYTEGVYQGSYNTFSGGRYYQTFIEKVLYENERVYVKGSIKHEIVESRFDKNGNM